MGDRGSLYVAKWAEEYLQGARARLAPKMKGFNLTIEDVYSFQELCAFEVREREFIRRVN